MKNCLLISFLLLFFLLPTYGQDLIEQTRLNLRPEKSTKVNELAKLVKKKWNYSSSRNSGISLFDYNATAANSRLDVAPVSDAVFLDLKEDDLSAVLKVRPDQMTFNIPVNEVASISLDLVRVDIFAPDFKVLLSDGTMVDGPQDAIFYKGIITGNTNSLVALSIFNNDIQGVISDAKGNYVLGKLGDVDQYTLFNDFKYKDPISFSCKTGDDNLTQTANVIRSVTDRVNRSSADVCVKVYFELDFVSYQQFNNNASDATTFLMGLFNAVQAVYLNEMINLEMTTPKIWTSNDPYGGRGGICNNSNLVQGVLSAFQSAMGNNFDGDLAHLITVLGGSGTICGLGNISCSCGPTPSVCNQPVWCNSNAQAYSQVFNHYQNYPTHSESVSLVSHEIGHNFGSQHTHACAWNGDNTAIDGCDPVTQEKLYSQTNCPDGAPSTSCNQAGIPSNGGTIMSYCSGISITNGFHQQVGDLMRANVANATCLTACTNAICAISVASVGTVTCGGGPSYTSSFSISATVANGSGNYQIVDASNAVIGSISSAATDGMITIPVSIAGATSVRSLSYTIRDAGDTACGASVAVSVPKCPDCVVNSSSAGAVTCSGYDASFTVTATVSNGSGSYQVYDGSTIIGSLTGATSGTINIPITLVGPSPSATSSFTIRDASLSSCSSDFTVAIPGCATEHNCLVPDLFISSDPPTGGSYASNTIVSSGIVEVSGNVTFTAGSTITLRAGFEVPAGNTFTAMIQSCTPLQQEEIPVNSFVGTPLSTKSIIPEVGLSIRPNPFSFTTNFDFSLSEDGPVTIHIYNLSGQLVDQVMQNQLLHKGEHSISYDASKLEDGMFHLVLNTAGGLHVKKLVVVK